LKQETGIRDRAERAMVRIIGQSPLRRGKPPPADNAEKRGRNESQNQPAGHAPPPSTDRPRGIADDVTTIAGDHFPRTPGDGQGKIRHRESPPCR
jgi:hypothetical protein